MPKLPILGQPAIPSKRTKRIDKQSGFDSDSGVYKKLKLSTSSAKISHYLRTICEFSDSADEEKEVEAKLCQKQQKKQIFSSEEKFLGLRRPAILNLKSYKIDPNNLPKLSSSFENFRPEQLATLLARSHPSTNFKVPSAPIKKFTASKEFPRSPIKPAKVKSGSKGVNDKVEGLLIKKA